MAAYLERAGDEHERGFVKKAAMAKKSGDIPEWDLADHHMLAAHEAIFERQCLDQVRALIAEAPWTVLPDAARTTDLRTRAFCMLSALGCLCHEMRVRHANFPFCVFGLVREGSAEAEAQALLAMCPEMHDAWSAAFVGYYKDRPGGLCSPEAKAELLHTLSIAKREIAQIEAGHASVRRGLVMHSVQTHTPCSSNMSLRRWSHKECERYPTCSIQAARGQWLHALGQRMQKRQTDQSLRALDVGLVVGMEVHGVPSSGSNAHSSGARPTSPGSARATETSPRTRWFVSESAAGKQPEQREKATTSPSVRLPEMLNDELRMLRAEQSSRTSASSANALRPASPRSLR